MVTHLDYTLIQGEPFERLVIVKDRRTHRIRKHTEAYASMQLADRTGPVYPIPTSRSFEGGILLEIDSSDTYNIAPGIYKFDVVANPYGYIETVGSGTIAVAALERITPLGGDAPMYIEYAAQTDYRKAVTWTSSTGVAIQVINARLQAVNATNVVVLDLGFYATPPTEATIAALPANKRGYISPLPGASFEIHISNQAVIAPGTYQYDILAQEVGTEDWGRVSTGTLVVTGTITQAP